MDCTKCKLKGCRTQEPCGDNSALYAHGYLDDTTRPVIQAAAALVDDGRAGTLNRLEEIITYAKIRGYEKIGVAYCYGLEKEAVLLRQHLDDSGLKAVMVSCTVDGLTQSIVDPDKTTKAVSCNPLGQAHALNRVPVDFTILMGLCLGHDILLQRSLSMDFTTFVVKDRVLNHHPLLALSENRPEDVFLENISRDFNLIKADDFKRKLQKAGNPDEFYLLDLRGPEAFKKDGLPGSTNCLLTSLPKHYKALFPDKSKDLIAYCNGGIQSVYAVMFLTMKGYQNVKSLSGGISSYFQKG
ncbi:DUF1847 domain-containing protein [Oscillospiraceae bacterium WX1]